jgi:hypothetical protein
MSREFLLPRWNIPVSEVALVSREIKLLLVTAKQSNGSALCKLVIRDAAV